MANECALFYGTVNGAAFEGDNPIAARAGSSEVLEVHHDLITVRDSASGHALGRRRHGHGPLRVLKRLDRASVLLRRALTRGETFSEVELRWYRPDPAGTGGEEHFYTIKIQNAVVSKVETHLPNTLDREQSLLPPQEWVEFVYETAIWIWVTGGIEAEDSWSLED